MKKYISIIIGLILITGCKKNRPESKVEAEEIFDCKKGEMTSAWYEHGIDEQIPNIQLLPSGFVILVDSNNKAKNFISFAEEYARERSAELDTTDLNWTDGWEKLTTKQKFAKLKRDKQSYLLKADSIHKINNKGQQQIWLINNSKDTVSIQMQDWSFICILQAKAKSGKWHPIQYWKFSTCGNSYFLKDFLPKTANSFITKLPQEGDYKTKLRYKLLAKDKYYYSNVFDGKIKYCSFVEDTSSYFNRRGIPKPHFKLDSLINFTRKPKIKPLIKA